MEVYRRFINKEDQSSNVEKENIKKHGSYGALLFDNRWKEKRAMILERDGNKCVICGFDEKLEVHHRQYHYLIEMKKFKVPWDYSEKLLITLCNSCHQRGHSKFKVPIIYL